MYCARNPIFVSSLCLILIGSLVHSIPAPPSDDDISPVHRPALFEKRWDCDNCPAKTVTDFCTITSTETRYVSKDQPTITKTETSEIKYRVTVTCTETVTKDNTVTYENDMTKTDTLIYEKTKTNTVTYENDITKTDTLTQEKTQTNTDTVIYEKTKTDEETKIFKVTDTVTNTVTETTTDTKTTTLPPNTVTDTVTDTKTKTVTATTTVLPCNKPVHDTPCDSPMFSFVSPESGQVLKKDNNFDVKYNITKLPGNQSGFVKDLQFYLVSSDLHCINQTIAQNADTTPTRVCNKSLQYKISACPKVPPGYYAIQVMYNFCNTTSGSDVCVFHDCKRGVVVKK